MRRAGAFAHLVRRAVTSLSNSPPTALGIERARSILLPGEMALWSSMQGRDRKHSLDVLERFEMIRPSATRPELAAALLHDVGKVRSNLGWFHRIVATTVGPRTARMKDYYDHERIGAAMLRGVSEERTRDLVGGRVADAVADALREADDI